MARVAIIGAGIGGLTAAIALQRRGIGVEVYEAAPELRVVGAGIWVPTNAMQVFARLGLSRRLEAVGVPIERIEVRDRRGGALQSIALAPFWAKFGHTTISLHRAQLQQALAEAVQPGTLRLGKQCLGVDADDAGVTARFADGSRATADVLIAADGIRSAIRTQLAPQIALRYSGQTCYRGVAALSLPAALQRTCREIWGGRTRFGFSAIGTAAVYWFAPISASADGTDPPGITKAMLQELYAAFPSPVPEILAHTPGDAIFRTDLFDFPPMRPWSFGRVVLLGDAAHATTPNMGQGGAQAIEDAYVLADCLAREATHTAAFQAYETARARKAARVVRLSWHYGRLAHLERPWLCAARNAMVRATPAALSRRQFDQLYSLNF